MFRLSSFRLLFLLLVAALFLGACGSKETVTLAPESALPDFAKEAPPTVQEAYRFAIENPHILEHQPCYCGCNMMGHTSNLSCYIGSYDESGEPVFDNHAMGCGICVDITQDVMRLMEDGKSQADIRTYIDATYSAFGPTTDTPLP